MLIEIPRKISGQPAGKIAYQSLTRDLRQHPPETVADRKLDARCCALFNGYKVIAEFALG